MTYYQTESRSNSVLDLNFLPVALSAQKIRVLSTDYPEEEGLENFRGRLGSDWYCWRDGNTVYLWSSVAESPPQGLKYSEAEIEVNEHPPMVSGMILKGFERELVRMGFTELGRKHRCFVNFSKGNFLAKCSGSVDKKVGVYENLE